MPIEFYTLTFEIVWVPNFRLIRSYLDQITQKEHFSCKKQRNKNPHKVLNIRISQVSKLQLQKIKIDFLEQVFQKKDTPI